MSPRWAMPSRRPVLAWRSFIHGLTGDEFCWSWGAEDAYGERLTSDLDCTAVYLRYNSGLHISENGRTVAALLEQLVEAWPVEVAQIALVGHSMGGLVARSAAHQADEDDHTWVRHVRHIVSLGTPHLGAPLEQGAHRAAAALDKLPETRMLSAFLRRRSAGIRDLRHGSLVDEDWRGRDPEALRAVACQEVPLLPWATHCFVSATVTRDPKHPLGRLLGDILVLVPSATGRGRTRRIPFRDEHGYHVGGTHHLALLNHPRGLRAPARLAGNGARGPCGSRLRFDATAFPKGRAWASLIEDRAVIAAARVRAALGGRPDRPLWIDASQRRDARIAPVPHRRT
jgi:pimeloyl-ACP methyl ester carboxylesterase